MLTSRFFAFFHVVLWLALTAPTSLRAQPTYRWQTLPGAPSNGQKQDDLFFLDAQNGWSVNGSGRIHRTRDGGQTWTRLLNRPGTYFRCIGFVDSLRGFAGNIGTNYFPGVTDTIPLYGTTDGGRSWQPVTQIAGPAPTGLCAIQVVSPQVLYAAGRVGGPAYLLRSADGGQTWTSRNLGAQVQMITDVQFVSADTGFVFGGTNANVQFSRAVVLYTTDGGQHFREVYRSPRSFELCWKAAFPTRRVGYLTLLSYAPNVPDRFVAKTTDGGLSWQELPLASNGCKEFGIGFVDETTGWVGTDTGTGFETHDGGLSWQASTLGRYINKVRLLRDTNGQLVTGYAIGLNLTRLQISNGPTAAPDLLPPAKPGLFQLTAAPNPASRRLTLRYYLPRAQVVTLRLTDASGKVLATVMTATKRAAGAHEEAFDLPATLGHNVVWVLLQTPGGRDSTAVSVQP